jgi:hypothetical protein
VSSYGFWPDGGLNDANHLLEFSSNWNSYFFRISTPVRHISI